MSTDLPAATSPASALSAPQTSIQHAAAAALPPVSPPPASQLDPEDAYLCAWLRSRLDLSMPPTLRLQEDSALTVTPSDQRAIWRLLRLARARSLDLWVLATEKAGEEVTA